MSIYHTLNKSLCELFGVEYNPTDDYKPNIVPFENCRGGYFDLTGKPQTEDHKKARSEALKGNIVCGWMKGKTWPKETIQKMSESANKRNENPEYIKKQSEAKKHLKTKYLVTNPNGEKYEIVGINQFCKENDLTHSVMVMVA